MSEHGEYADRASVIKVCVVMLVYKHERCVENAIKGVLMQEADCDIQLVIGEDCSPDGSREICERYALQNPDKIRLLDSARNLGIQGNCFRSILACEGADYIAFCEGDDVWIDKHKVQHQVEFLEKNRNYLAHAHNVIRRDMSKMEDSDFGERADKELTTRELFMGWPFHIVSLMVRAELLLSVPVDRLPAFVSGDRFVNMWIGSHGSMFYEGNMLSAIYHRHPLGASSNENMSNVRQQDLAMLTFFKDYLKDKELYREARLEAIKSAFYTAAYFGSPIARDKWRLILEYIRTASLRESSYIWFLSVMIFGRNFLRLRKVLKGRLTTK